MAIRTDFAAGEVLAAADLNDTFGAKLNLAGGKILQVVRATDTTNRSTTSATFVDVTGMSVTITPQKSTSAIILIGSVLVFNSDFTGIQFQTGLQIADSSNNAISGAENSQVVATGPSGNTVLTVSQTLIGYATPATTSAVTYKMRFRAITANDSIQVVNADQTGQLYAIEVSA